MANTEASAASALKTNSLRGEPLPQRITLSSPSTLASWNFLISAASTWEFSRPKLSLGPYMEFGTRAMNRVEPY